MADPLDMFKDLVSNLSKQEMDEAVKIGSERRRILTEGQKPDAADFGLSASNPICLSTVESAERYLSSLRLERDYSSFTFSRNGSITTTVHGINGTSVDEYELVANNSNKDKFKIYICPYGHDSDYQPVGLKLSKYTKSTKDDETAADILIYALGNRTLDLEEGNDEPKSKAKVKKGIVRDEEFWKKFKKEYDSVMKINSAEIDTALNKAGLLMMNGDQIIADITFIGGFLALMSERLTFEQFIVREAFLKNVGKTTDDDEKNLKEIFTVKELDLSSLSEENNVAGYLSRMDEYKNLSQSFKSTGDKYLPASYFAAYAIAFGKENNRFANKSEIEKFFEDNKLKYKQLAETFNSVAEKMEKRINKLFTEESAPKESKPEVKSVETKPVKSVSNSVKSNQSTHTIPIVASKPQKEKKKKFCKYCGGEINPYTNICKKCGHKYFKLKLNKYLIIIVAMAVIIAVLAGVIISQVIRKKSDSGSDSYDTATYTFSYDDDTEPETSKSNYHYSTHAAYTTEATTAHEHNYKLVSTIDATCYAEGYKMYQCSCGDSYEETIPAGHKYSKATCTEPKKCKVCGTTEGSALGHSFGSDGKCTRCGKAKFGKKTYTGTDVGYVNNLNMPAGTYNIYIEFETTLQYSDYFSAYFTSSEGTVMIANNAGAKASSVYTLTLDEDETNCSINVRNGTGNWKITIEQVK